jgi:integral membrane sensor domain MASE1
MKGSKADKKRALRTYLAIFPALALINTILARFGVIARPIGLGCSGLYFSVAFMIVFALWFGGWGVLAAYIGCYLGAGMLSGVPHDINLYWSLADVWQVLLPLAAFKAFNADVGLRTKRDFSVFLSFGWLLNNVAGAAWGASTLALGGLAAWTDVPYIFSGWLVGNLIVTMAITPILLRYGTGYLRARELLVHQYWA